MAADPGNANYDAILTTTLESRRKELVDNVFIDLPLTSWLTDRGRMKMDAGAKLLIPLLTKTNGTVAAYANYDTLALTPSAGLTSAEYAWKQVAATVAIAGMEEAQNQGGQTQHIKLLDTKIMQAEMSLKDYFNSMLFSDGSVSGDFNGLANLVDSTGTVGGIVYDAFPDWTGYEVAGSVRSDDVWTTAYNTISNGSDRPDAVFTTQTLFESYEASLVPQLRFTSNKEADSRFQNLMFKGAPVFWDADCTAGVTYFLNSKYIGLYGMEGNWFTNTPFVKPADKDARYSQIIARGQFAISNRSRCGKITSQTA